MDTTTATPDTTSSLAKDVVVEIAKAAAVTVAGHVIGLASLAAAGLIVQKVQSRKAAKSVETATTEN